MLNVNEINEKDLIRVEEKENMFNKCKDFVFKNTKKNEKGKRELLMKRSEVINKFEEFGLTNESAKNYYYLIVNKSDEFEKKESKKEKVEQFIQKFPNLTTKEYIKNFMNFFEMSESCARTYIQNHKREIKNKNEQKMNKK